MDYEKIYKLFAQAYNSTTEYKDWYEKEIKQKF